MSSEWPSDTVVIGDTAVTTLILRVHISLTSLLSDAFAPVISARAPSRMCSGKHPVIGLFISGGCALYAKCSHYDETSSVFAHSTWRCFWQAKQGPCRL